ncbi:ROK family transcriptional regulator [Streptomyces sp. Ag109_O5-10]|uniref:ROK family transcriptional regulator n=1 Tax=Streptomyces sp. Ag109_O5-10 TaxID=1855349 RepID=UPI000894BD72|nr:ROK family transcriptional regulator [Streptomyces sp. Ag109_O5-10]SEF14496.1 Sugar kinase of the NBD/HSP70 family, may contain an N-terminal HTH domain [Streptomyces sp. Ag109_O5-10]
MPASPSTARAINDRLALSLLQQEGPLTAGQLKQLTGLSRPTVADLVERLTVSGLITVVGEAGEQRRGPNARLYGIVADRAYLAALDVRTESVSVLVSDLVGRVLADGSVPVVPEEGEAAAVGQAVELVERAAKEAGASGDAGRLHTVGIGAPGLVDPATGELRDSAGLPAWHRGLVAALQERFPQARIDVENETNLAALAEQREGAARDRDTFVLLWLGSSCGAAVVLDGSLRRGASGGTGEIGFLPVPGTTGLPTATDCSGGYHSLVGAAAVVELAGECGVGPAGATAASLVAEAAADAPHGGAGNRATSPDGAAAGHRPNPAHVRFLDTLADRIALGVAAVVAVLDPGCVVLGGEIGPAGGAALAARVEARLRRMSPLATEVRAGALGGAAVLRGALLTARERAQDELFAAPDR